MSLQTASPAVVQLLSGAVGALALAHTLGAPRSPVDDAVDHLMRLVDGRMPPLPALKPRRRRRKRKKKLKPLQDSQVLTPSAWDPEPVSVEIEASQCRALLLDIMRRAIHDWVLYRHHSRMALREIAQEAKIWLFDEKPGHPYWEVRHAEAEMQLTSFLGICDLLDVDPDFVRRRARSMTIQDIRTAGRPPERRRSQKDGTNYHEHAVTKDVNLSSIDRPEPGRSPNRYEAHFHVGTSSVPW